jgi:hypothetical protein
MKRQRHERLKALMDKGMKERRDENGKPCPIVFYPCG